MSHDFLIHESIDQWVVTQSWVINTTVYKSAIRLSLVTSQHFGSFGRHGRWRGYLCLEQALPSAILKKKRWHRAAGMRRMFREEATSGWFVKITPISVLVVRPPLIGIRVGCVIMHSIPWVFSVSINNFPSALLGRSLSRFRSPNSTTICPCREVQLQKWLSSSSSCCWYVPVSNLGGMYKPATLTLFALSIIWSTTGSIVL